jgi:hypothetical protein
MGSSFRQYSAIIITEMITTLKTTQKIKRKGKGMSTKTRREHENTKMYKIISACFIRNSGIKA